MILKKDLEINKRVVSINVAMKRIINNKFTSNSEKVGLLFEQTRELDKTILMMLDRVINHG